MCVGRSRRFLFRQEPVPGSSLTYIVPCYVCSVPAALATQGHCKQGGAPFCSGRSNARPVLLLSQLITKTEPTARYALAAQSLIPGGAARRGAPRPGHAFGAALR